MATYGLTPEGFVKKPLEIIKQEIEADLKNSFGSEIDLESSSVFGQFVGNQSKKFTELWELAQAVYNNFDPDGAEGVSLDNVSALIGVTRLAATGSVVTVILYGTLSTVVSAGHIVQQQDTDEQLTSNDDTTISLSSLADSTISVATVQDTTLYTVTINGTAFDYTSDASATAEEIMAGLKVEVDAGSEPVIFTDNLDGTARILADDLETAYILSLTANLQTDLTGTPSAYTMTNTGALPIPTNTINTIITAVGGLDSVDNLAPGVSGRDVETDVVLRNRRRQSVAGIGNATDPAITTKLLQLVDGVSSVLVVSNRTLITDGDGRPAKSYEAVVIGGVDQDIADLLWEIQPSGIESYGTTTETVVDSTGKNQTIKFSRPDIVYIWFNIQIGLYSEEIFPPDGLTQIQAAVLAETVKEFSIGKDAIYQRFIAPCYTVPGVGTVTIEIGESTSSTTPPGAYAAANIAITDRELAQTILSNINIFF